MKHVQRDKEALSNQILYALLETSSTKNEPVKLAEITEKIYGASAKEKQDVVRLTTEKTLIRCGIVDKIYFSERDVRYFPAAYRFQETNRLETGTGAKIEQSVGDIVAFPREYWPIPKEYFELVASKAACEDTLAKVEEDFRQGLVSRQTSQKMRRKLQDDLEAILKRLKEYDKIAEVID